MLPKTWRIPKKEFSRILSRGKRYNSTHFILYVLEDVKDNPKNSRFAFSVSKKVSKTAVGRNKLRRQGYAVIQKNKQILSPGSFMFFSYKKTTETPKFENINKEILELLSVSGVVL